MSRPKKSRRICSPPDYTRFIPQEERGQPVVMSLDEYEVIRLIDHAEMNQEQCAGHMGIARTTVQSIYAAARKKLAECIVNGLPLHIGGGDVHFCELRSSACRYGHCIRCCIRKTNFESCGKEEYCNE